MRSHPRILAVLLGLGLSHLCSLAVLAQSGNNSQFISQNVPTTMLTGEVISVSVTMSNAGSTTWTAAASYRLGSQDPQDNLTWGTGRAFLSGSDSIAPGQQKTFTFNITAPSTPGTYGFQWRMLEEGVEWFGAFSPAVNIQVITSTSGDGAFFISQSEPTSLGTGQVQSISVTLLNSGSTTWTRALNYKLGSQNPQDNLTWGVGRVLLASTASIAPGQQVTFTFNITAPSTGGNYNLQWRMLREGVAWFGDFTPNVVVTVAQLVTLCPGVQVVADGLTDAAPALQQCINNTASGGTLQIPAAAYGMGGAVNITKPITIRTAGTAGSTQNCTGSISCATLRARPDLYVFGGFVFLNNTTDVTLDHLIFDGNRSARLGSAAAGQCPSQSRYGYNVRVAGCTYCNFLYNLDENTLCGTSLEWVGDNATIDNNVFRGNGDHSQTNMWSDGLTLLGSNGANVTGNTFTDNSDVALILGGSRNGYVANNTITQAGQAAFAAFSLDNFAGTASGDYTGAIVTGNTISCGASHLCDFGMNFGPHAWLSSAPNIQGGSVHGNTVSSAKQGINVDGAGTTANPLVLYSNSSTGSPSSATFNCGVRSTSNLNIFTGGSVVNRNGDTTPATNVAWDNCP